MSALPPTTDDAAIWELWLSQYRLPTVTSADEAGVFAAICDQALTADQIAAQISVDARALTIHLGLLAAMGFVEKRDNKWRATALSRTWLIPDSEGYYGPAIHGFRETNPLHERILETLRTGDAAGGHMSAVEEWERGDLPPEMATRITAYMNAHSRATSRAAARQDVFSGVRSLMDVGGGSGIFSIEIARAWPHLAATIMEIDIIAGEARGYIDAAGLSDRISTASVNMFTEDWPTGHDAHFFSNVFHDWSDKTCRMLAQKSFDALAPGGQIVLHEMLMDDDGCGPWTAAAFSLLMLLGTRGKQYSLPELKDMLSAAGFTDITATATGASGYALVTGRKP